MTHFLFYFLEQDNPDSLFSFAIDISDDEGQEASSSLALGIATVKIKYKLEESEESKVIDELKEYEKVAFTKNSTSAMYAKGFKEYMDNLKNLKKIILSGCCTDICVMNLALDLQNYFDENNKNIDIIVPKDVVETYSGPNHNREEYNEIAFKIMNNAGIKLVKTWRNI